MHHKTSSTILVMLITISMLLGACQPVSTPIPTQPVLPTSTTLPTQPPAPTTQPTQPPPPTPTSPPPRTGAWVDQLVFTEQVEASAAVSQIKAGDIDIFATAITDPAVYQAVKSDPDLSSVQSVGNFNELTLNPSGPEFTDGRLNPFNDPRLREALNWLIDRNYIAQEIFSGLAAPRYVPTSSFYPDYARYIDIIRQLEVKYAYDKAKASQVITDEMASLGATLSSDGKWQYKGAPVVLIGIIRTEDRRKQIGDYISDQLESIGFTVDRQYKDRSGAAPIWMESDPKEGLWHFYTGGWIVSSISRDDSGNFGWLYTSLGSSAALWQAYTPSDEFWAVSQKLWNSEFVTMDERRALWAEALPLSMQDSSRVMLVDQLGSTIMGTDINVSYDLSGGVAGSFIYPYTVQIKGTEGGTVKIAQPGILVEPWNPLAGSPWIFDVMPQHATSEGGTMPDPYTGLYWPLRIEKADVVVKEGLPVAKTLDWLTLTTAPKIEVPSDAWVDWDASTQTFITAGEKYTQTLETNSKVTIYYPQDLFKTVKWHDGSLISSADFIMYLIMIFDPGKADSPIYDESMVPLVDGFLSHFKGIKILSTDPLVFEFYDDAYYLDAETMVATSTAFPPAPWQTLALGYLADSSTDKHTELAFTSSKAALKEVEWMSFVSGPSLDILNGWTTKASNDNYIPYAATMGQYVSTAEATLRWSNLQQWYTRQGHFWLGTGPFYLDHVYPTEKTLTLNRFADYPDPATRWMNFGSPMLASVSVEGPQQVTTGDEPLFDVYVTFEDQPYPTEQINVVKYLVFDSSKATVASGEALMSEPGHYTITLPKELTSSLPPGANILEVVVSSKAVSIPVIKDVEFISQSP